MMAQELLDRYVHAVGQQLPQKQREDVKAELRSLLAEMLEDRAVQAGQAPDLELAVQMLREFGHPDQVAARYWPAQHLIGPDYYPAFVKITRIVLTVLSGLFLAAAAYRLSQAPGPWLAAMQELAEILFRFAGYALANIGLMVVIFMVVERFLDHNRRPEPWDPRTLPAVEDPDKLDRGSLIAGIGFIAVLLAVFNFFPNLIAFFFVTDDVWGRWPVLTEGFRQQFLPWLNALWIAEITLNVLALRQGRWRLATRWAEFALNAAGLIVLYRLIWSANILQPSFFDVLIKIGLVVVLIIGAIETAAQLYRLIARLRNPPARPIAARQR